jgi:cytochrome P450
MAHRPTADPDPDPAAELILTRYRAVCEVLASPAYTVPRAGPAAGPGTLAWLRATVSRFCDGADHARRRTVAVRELAAIQPDRLRRDTHDRTLAELRRAAPGPVDLMARLARLVPVATLSRS